jgi:hypothetical protein
MLKKYIILRDLTSIQGAKFFKNEVVLGKANNNGYHIDVIRENGYKNNLNNLIKDKDIKKVSETTPLTDELLVRNYVKKSNQINLSLSVVGAIGGISLAYFKKQGFLEYMAFGILGAIAGFGIGSYVNSKRTLIIPMVDDKKEEEIKSSQTDNKTNTNN